MSDLQVSNLSDLIRDRVRSTIMATIPDDQIDKLIGKEWDAFFSKRKPKDQWDAKPTDSQFETMVRKELNDFIEAKIKTAMQAEMDKFNQNIWDQKGKDAIKDIVSQYAPFAMQSISEMVVSNAMVNLRNAMNNSGIRF